MARLQQVKKKHKTVRKWGKFWNSYQKKSYSFPINVQLGSTGKQLIAWHQWEGGGPFDVRSAGRCGRGALISTFYQWLVVVAARRQRANESPATDTGLLMIHYHHWRSAGLAGITIQNYSFELQVEMDYNN